jgi:hypothetical protein
MSWNEDEMKAQVENYRDLVEYELSSAGLDLDR